MDYRQMIKEQLGEGWRFIKAYNAFESGELRMIAADETGRERPARGCLPFHIFFKKVLTLTLRHRLQ